MYLSPRVLYPNSCFAGQRHPIFGMIQTRRDIGFEGFSENSSIVSLEVILRSCNCPSECGFQAVVWSNIHGMNVLYCYIQIWSHFGIPRGCVRVGEMWSRESAFLCFCTWISQEQIWLNARLSRELIRISQFLWRVQGDNFTRSTVCKWNYE